MMSAKRISQAISSLYNCNILFKIMFAYKWQAQRNFQSFSVDFCQIYLRSPGILVSNGHRYDVCIRPQRQRQALFSAFEMIAAGAEGLITVNEKSNIPNCAWCLRFKISFDSSYRPGCVARR